MLETTLSLFVESIPFYVHHPSICLHTYIDCPSHGGQIARQVEIETNLIVRSSDRI